MAFLSAWSSPRVASVLVLHLLHARVHLELVRLAHGLEQGPGHGRLHLGREGSASSVLLRRPRAWACPPSCRSCFCRAQICLMTAWPSVRARHHLGLGELLGPRLDHHDGVLGAGHEQVELALGAQVRGGGVHDALPVPVAHPHRGHRVVEGDVGDVEGGGGAGDGQGVGVVLHVRGEQQADHLGLAGVALREERPQRPVDHARGQDLLLVRPALALEEPAGDLARGVGVLAVVHGQGQEVHAHPRLLLRAGGGQHHRVAQADEDRAVGLLGHAPGLDGQGVPAQGHL